MLTILQTLCFLFGTAFILGFFSRDVETLLTSIFNSFKSVTEGGPQEMPTPTPAPQETPAPPSEPATPSK